jgi:gas vesicle protein
MCDHQDERNVIGNFLLGLGIGALIGGATALLLAPKVGSETREDIKHATEDFKQKATKVAQDLTDSGEELIKKSREMLEVTKEKVQDAIDAGKKAVALKAGETKEPAEEKTEA